MFKADSVRNFSKAEADHIAIMLALGVTSDQVPAPGQRQVSDATLSDNEAQYTKKLTKIFKPYQATRILRVQTVRMITATNESKTETTYPSMNTQPTPTTRPSRAPLDPEARSVVALRDGACVGGAIASLGLVASAGVDVANHAIGNPQIEQLAHEGTVISGAVIALSIAAGAVSAVLKQRG